MTETDLDPNNPADIRTMTEIRDERIEETRRQIRAAAREADINIRTEARTIGLSGGYVKAQVHHSDPATNVDLETTLRDAGLSATVHRGSISVGPWVSVDLVSYEEVPD